VKTQKSALFFVSILTLVTLSFNVSANKSDKILEQQRQDFLKAEYIAHKPKSYHYRKLLKQLKSYPLYPYIELKTLMRFPYLSNKEQIARFLERYEGTPLDRPLRKKWLKYLAQKKQQALFLHFYRDLRSPELTCTYLKYQLERQDMRLNALDEIDKLWLVGKSQPKTCDPLFKVWQQAGRRTPDMIWQRLVLAADGGKHTLIPYLKKLLPIEQRYLADLWYKTRRDPSYVSRPSRFPGKITDKETQILTYGLTRLIWRDRELALKSWHKLQKRFDFSPLQQQQIASKFAIGLAIKNHPKSGYWLTKANRLQEDQELFRWHLAHELRQKNWKNVLDITDAAPDKISQDLFYQYWQARSYAQIDAKQLATEQLNKLSDRRHYYGFLASGQLKQNVEMADTPLIFTEQELQAIENLPGAKRAKEFLKLKRYVSARKEWIYLQRKLSPEQQQVAAVIADSWNWHDQAIFTFSRSGYLDDVKRRFPLAFKDELLKHSKAHNIPAAWAFAIARKESSFMIDANSGVGAKGLMQLMPGTAKFLAKKRVKTRTLFEPETNVRYGTQYLRYLLDKTDENPILATAAYNAGWRRVKDWLPDTQGLPMDIWVETIPYKETRDYVKSVMAYKQIYLMLLGKQQPLFEELTQMHLTPADFSF